MSTLPRETIGVALERLPPNQGDETMSMTTEAFADKPVRPLISRTSVLILGGFLVGITYAQTIDAGIRSYVLLAGSCGIVAFMGLSCVASYRRKRSAQRASDQLVLRMEQRVEQHLSGSAVSEAKSSDRTVVGTTGDVDETKRRLPNSLRPEATS